MPSLPFGRTPAYLVKIGVSYTTCQTYARKLVSMERRLRKKQDVEAERTYLLSRRWQMENCLAIMEQQTDEALLAAFEQFGVTSKTPRLFADIEASDRMVALLDKAVEEKRARGEMTFPGRAPAQT